MPALCLVSIAMSDVGVDVEVVVVGFGLLELRFLNALKSPFRRFVGVGLLCLFVCVCVCVACVCRMFLLIVFVCCWSCMLVFILSLVLVC